MTGRIPQDYLDRLLSRVDLVELIQSRTPLRRAGREFVACCPFHAEKTPSFSVSPSKQFYHCFGCNAHGTAIGFLMAYDRLEFRDAVEELARFAGLEPPQATGSDTAARSLLEPLRQADHYFRRQLRRHPTRQRAVDYLRQRGLSGEIAQRFGLGYAPPGLDVLCGALRAAGVSEETLLGAGLASRDEQGRLRDRFWDRVIFPIRDRRGRTIAFGGRTLAADGVPKYLNSPETPLFHKGLELYGLYEARTVAASPARLIVVEGYLDVAALAQHGISEAVATLGTAITSAQVERLFRTTSTLVFCFDGDRAGQAAGWRALETALPWMGGGRRSAFLFLPQGEDPDSLIRREGPAAFESRLAQATPLADYLFEELRRRSDPDSLAGRAQMATLARPLLEKLPDDPFRDLLSERLLREAGLSATRLRPAPAAAAPTDRRLRLIRTPLRKAIALLLYRPELARQTTVNPLDLGGPADSGMRLLAELLEILRAQPHLSTAALLERYRDTREGAILARLAAWEPEGAEADYRFAVEFSDILAYLHLQQGAADELAPEIMLRRGAPSALSVEEREAVRNLGKKRSRSPLQSDGLDS